MILDILHLFAVWWHRTSYTPIHSSYRNWNVSWKSSNEVMDGLAAHLLSYSLCLSLVRHDVFRSNWLCFSLLAYAYSMKDNNDFSAKQESTTNAADTHSYVFVYECIGNDGCIFFLYLFVSGRQFNWDARVSKTEWPLDVDGALPWIDRMKSSRHANSELWCDHRWWGTHTPSRRTHTVVLVVHSSIIRKPATKGDEHQAPGTCRSSSHKCAWHWKIISCDKLNTLSYFIIILPYAWCIHHQI